MCMASLVLKSEGAWPTIQQKPPFFAGASVGERLEVFRERDAATCAVSVCYHTRDHGYPSARRDMRGRAGAGRVPVYSVVAMDAPQAPCWSGRKRGRRLHLGSGGGDIGLQCKVVSESTVDAGEG